MKAPLSWLREFVDVDPELSLKQLAYRLTMAGLEVEEIHTVGADWRNVFIARVADLQRHPRADTLSVATLDLGGKPATVVTAATNLRVGALVPYVAPGGRLPGGEVGTRTFQGITSEGMVTSGDELGISPDKDGIYILEEGAPVGETLASYLADAVLDIYITTNRPDCMSIVGIAREIHALTGAPFRHPTSDPPRGKQPASQLVSVRIEDPVGCPRFTASVVQGVTIGPSPLDVQRRLYLCGIRPISNVVDVTNYVMLEVGQPLHAFDRARLHGSIVVRRGRPGERITTLDGVERTLDPSMMVVADEEGPRSIAGIMGGADSEISDDTRDVVIEGASWDRAITRLTSAALGLSTEASRRFGRGVDPDLTALAVSRATELTVRLAGGEPADGLVDEYPGREATAVRPITIAAPGDVNRLLGSSYSRDQVVDALEALEFGVTDNLDGTIEVSVPGHRRFDVTQRADLVEEVGRIVGYESIPASMLRGQVPTPRADGDAGYADELRARRVLSAAGLQEVITYTLVEPDLLAKLDASSTWPSAVDEAETISLRVQNPQSAELSALRPSLLGPLLSTLRSNLRHADRVLLFELGRSWSGTLDPLPDERRHVGLVMTGPRDPASWSSDSTPLDVYDLKGVVEALLGEFRVDATFGAAAHPSLHPGRSAEVCLADGARLGTFGQLHPRVAERFDLEGHAVLVAEIDFEVLRAARRPLEKASTPPRYPEAERDVAIVVEEHVSHADVDRLIRESGAPLLAHLRLFDVYRGDPIPSGRKSLAYALSYQAPDRTLEDEEVAAAHARVEERLKSGLGAEIRGR